MIIDGHAYCFPPLGEASGFPTAREHLRYLQREMADHHQPVWRLRDRAPGDHATLADPADRTLAGLRDVGFRAGGHGRFVWNVNGAEYAKQYLPPYLTDLSHPPEMLVAQMDHVGVDRAVLHANPIMGMLNGYLAECVRRFPDRLLALASIAEWEIEKDPEARVAEVARAYADGLHGYQFIMNFFTLSAWPRPTVDDDLAQLRTWRGWLERYPGVPTVHTHGFPWRLFRDGGRLRLPAALFEPFQVSTASLQLLFQISLGNIWDYPYPELATAVAQLVDTLGSDRLMWGTDMPNVERFCNYRQISDADIDNIVGGTAAQLFRLDGGR